MKLLSLTSKDFETGFSSSASNTKLGLFYSGTRINPFISEGTLRWSQEPVEIGAGTVVGTPQKFAISGGDAYANDASGNIYKIADVFGNPTVTKTKTGLTNTYGLEVFKTTNSLNYLYYWQNTQIGRMKISDGTFTDSWKAITTTYRSDVNPTIRIDDELYFGSKNVVSKIVDTGADTNLVEAVLDLPIDYIITALSTDGNYLIITASKSVSSTLDYAETKAYFWDYKNNLPSWTVSYPIRDPQIRSMYTMVGITYAVGQYGLYGFAFTQEPVLLRDDVRNTVGYGNISRIKDAITFGDSNQCITYGKLKPGAITALFKPFRTDGSISCMDTFSSNTIGLFGTVDNKIYTQILNTGPTTYNQSSFTLSRIDLGGLFQIERVDFIFDAVLASSADLVSSITIQGNTGSTSFTPFTQTNFGSVANVKCVPTAGSIPCDAFNLFVTGIYGSFRIRAIEIYGQRIER